MCITINLLKEIFDAHDTAEVLGTPLGDDVLTRWEILKEQDASPQLDPDTVYISDSLKAVTQSAQDPCGHLVFCAGPAFEKPQLPHTCQGCILLVQTEQTECIAQVIQERFRIENKKKRPERCAFRRFDRGSQGTDTG